MVAINPFASQPAAAVDARHVLIPRDSAPLWEQAVISLWLLVSFIPFPRDELILYPLVLYFIGMSVLRYEQIVPVAFRCWPLLLLPILAAASTLWSPASSAALRFGIMMTLTAIIAIYIAARLTPREIVRAAFVACAISAIIATNEVPRIGTLDGLYSQKNIFSIRMQLITIVSLGVALDRVQNILLRLAAVPFVIHTAILVLRAESATALLLASGSIALMVGIWLVWTNVSKVQHLRTLLVLLTTAVFALGVLVFLNMPNNTFLNDSLFQLGKDTTLTNRTVLWADAARLAEQKPWLGVGAAGFWIPDNGAAESILDYSYKDPGTRFSFHSVFYEVLVHLGLFGLALMLVQIFWVFSGAIRHWSREPGMAQALLLLIVLSTIIVSFTESYLFGVVEIGIVLFLVAGVSAVAGESKFRRVLAIAPPPIPEVATFRS